MLKIKEGVFMGNPIYKVAGGYIKSLKKNAWDEVDYRKPPETITSSSLQDKADQLASAANKQFNILVNRTSIKSKLSKIIMDAVINKTLPYKAQYTFTYKIILPRQTNEPGAPSIKNAIVSLWEPADSDISAFFKANIAVINKAAQDELTKIITDKDLLKLSGYDFNSKEIEPTFQSASNNITVEPKSPE